MVKNQRGDALTLALAAAVFVGISVMVLIAVLGNLDARVKRSRMVNEVESLTLFMNQVLDSRDLCGYAMRQANGQSILLDEATVPTVGIPAAPGGAVINVDIGRVYLTTPLAFNQVPASNPIFCRGDDPDPNCPALMNMSIRSMQFRITNNTSNNRPFSWKGSNTNYRVYTGHIMVDVDFNAGTTLGGDLQARSFPVNFVIDTGAGGGTPGNIELCYTSASPAVICSLLGGSIDPVSGSCQAMFGQCSVPPLRPTSCSSFPDSACPTAAGLRWTTIFYAERVERAMQMSCSCYLVCSTSGP